jgi:polyisoprenoid-binding protein YceI
LTLLALGLATASVFLPLAIGQTTPRDTAQAAEKTPGKPSGRRPLKPGQIDVDHSRVYVYVGKKRLGHAHAVEGKIKSGSLNVKSGKAGNEITGEIVFDMASFSADTDEARKQVELEGSIAQSTREQVTETMTGPDVLDVEHFPTATFTIKSAGLQKGRKSDAVYDLKGELTLHGKTRPLAIVAEQSHKDDRLRYRGDFTILQTEFGITPYKAALGTVGVADELKIWGDIWVAPPEPDRK